MVTSRVGVVMAKFQPPQVVSAKVNEAIGMLATNVDDLYRILNRLSPALPPGLVLSIANEGTGAEVYDTTSVGIAYLRTIQGAGTYAAAIVTSTLAGDLLLTFVPSAVVLNAFASPNADVSMNSHKITNMLNPTNPQDGATKAYVDALPTITPGHVQTRIMVRF